MDQEWKSMTQDLAHGLAEGMNEIVKENLKEANLFQPVHEVESIRLFKEFHSRRDGSPIYINLERIVLVAPGEDGAMIRTTSDTLGVQVKETYEEVKQIIEG